MECHFQGFFPMVHLRLEVQKLLLKKPSEEPLPEKDPLTGEAFGRVWSDLERSQPGFDHIVGYPKIVGKTI